MKGNYYYSIYGLLIASNHTLPGLKETTPVTSPDLRINIKDAWPEDVTQNIADDSEQFSAQTTTSPVTLQKIYHNNDKSIAYYLLKYPDNTVFLIDKAAGQIWIDWSTASTLDDAMAYFAGPVLGVALQIRGIVCLHASAVAVKGHAIAFLAPSGSGKSTLATALAGRGHAVLSDDVVALYPDNNLFIVHPGYPRLRLWPDSVQGLLGSAEDLAPLSSSMNKRFLDLTEAPYHLSDRPLPLAAIYTCNPENVSASPKIYSVSPPESLLTLVANTYPNPHYSLGKTARALEFDLLGKLVQHVPLRFIAYRDGMHYLDRLCDCIVKDAGALIHTGGPGAPQPVPVSAI